MFPVSSRTFDAPKRDEMYARTTPKYANLRGVGHSVGHCDEAAATDGSTPVATAGADPLRTAIKAAIDAGEYEVAALLLGKLKQ